LSKYVGEKFDLFPSALKRIDKVKEKEEWGKELDYLLCHRMNEVVNAKGHVLWAMTNGEYVKVQLFYNAIKKEFFEIDKLGGLVIKKSMKS